MATVYRRQGGRVWWIRFQHHRRRIHRSAHTKNKAEALRYLARVQDELRRQDRGDLPQKTFLDMAERFSAEHLPLLRFRTARSYRTHIRMMSQHFGSMSLDRVGKQQIADYIGKRRRAGCRPPTIRRHLTTLSSMFSRAMGWGWINVNPVRTIDTRSIPNSKWRTRYLTRAEFDTLLTATAPHLRPLLEVAVETGMRLGEMLSLTWSQVSFERREVILHETKNGKPRVVPLSPRAAAVFGAISRHQTSSHVFCDHVTGQPFTTIRKGFVAACRRAGITDLRFHDLRHTFASWAVQSGMDLYRLARILGHADTQMTVRYSHLATEDLHDAIEKMAAKLAVPQGQDGGRKEIAVPQAPR